MENNEKVTTLNLLDKKKEAGNVYSFFFNVAGLVWQAGQNQGFILPELGDDENVNQHWFTVASAPKEGVVQISTRISESLYKKTLANLAINSEVKVYGLGGDFVWSEEVNEKRKVFVAGGIGVTPFRSMILERHLSGKSIDVDLIYFNRTEEIPFLQEFETIAEKHPEFKIIKVIGKPVVAEEISALSPYLETKEIYLSGPEPMVKAVSEQFKTLGLTAKEDRFPGYNKINY